MKKIRFILPLLAAIVLTIAFAQCTKDTKCKAVIKVYYSETGIDTGQVAANVQVEIGTNSNFAQFAQATGTTDDNGVLNTLSTTRPCCPSSLPSPNPMAACTTVQPRLPSSPAKPLSSRCLSCPDRHASWAVAPVTA